MDEEVEDTMSGDPVLNHLAHYGVKGMRWGVRRKVGPGGRIVGKGKKKKASSFDYKSTESLKKRPVRTLSNMQLKKVNERMQLESKFRQMNPTRAAKGKSYVDELLKVGTGAAGVVGVVKLLGNPKNQAMVKRGAQVLAFKASPQGRLLSQVGRGKFG